MKHILVVDIEATCWEDKQARDSEIIQIGICRMCEPLFRLPTIVVKPQHSEVSEFCTTLTGLTQETVNQGVTLDSACARISLFLCDAWASYGDYDRWKFESECRAKGVRYPWPKEHYNIKHLVQQVTGQRLGMRAALEYFGLPLEGRHHDGGDDAHNISRILEHIRVTTPERITGEFVGLA